MLANAAGYSAALKFFIHDKNRSSIEYFGWQSVHIDQFILSSDIDGDLLFDIDLCDAGLICKLIKRMANASKLCRVFILDQSDRLSIIHANKLGSFQNLPRSCSLLEIENAIIQFHFGNASNEVRLFNSISAAADSLNSAFAIARSGEQTSPDEIDQAAFAIVDIIQDGLITDWLDAVKSHHVGTFQHCLLVTGTAGGFAKKLGMSQRDIQVLTVAGLVHDLGKAFIPLHVLDKPGSLTNDEMQLIRHHPELGELHLRKSGGFSAEVLRYVRSHHEMLDGSGYPDQLVGAGISDLTRIVTICDIYAALIERRSYKPAMSSAEANAKLSLLAKANKLDADLVREFVR